MRKILRERDEGGQNNRERIFRHLIEVATAWTIIHAGKDYDVASGRDSVEAAKLIFGYDLGKHPPSAAEFRLALATHFRQVAKDAAEIVLAALGSRKEKMEPADIAEFIGKVGVNTVQYLQQADAVIGGHAVHADDGPRSLTDVAPALDGQEPSPDPAKDGEAIGLEWNVCEGCGKPTVRGKRCDDCSSASIAPGGHRGPNPAYPVSERGELPASDGGLVPGSIPGGSTNSTDEEDHDAT